MLQGRTGLSPVMVGRARPLARLVGLVEAAEVAACDRPEVALIAGEPGIGKSRLLRELSSVISSQTTVLSVGAQPGSLGRSFDVIGQLCPGSSNPADDALRIVAEAANASAVLIVEDLHWADADSVHVLDQLLQQALPRLVVIGTYRPGDLSRHLPGGEFVSRLERQHTVEQVRLERLNRHEVGLLLQAIGNGVPTSGAVETYFRRSGGIPFVIEELVRCCGPDACTDDVSSAQLPWSLDEAVQQQLNALDATARRVVDSLAVFGDPAPFDLLASVTELDDATLLTNLRDLVNRDVVVESSDDTFWFSHALTADSVSQHLLGRERRRLHQRCLDAMAVLDPVDHAALARHAAGAGSYERIAEIAREGAPQYLRRGATFQALRLASEGLAEVPDDPVLLRVAADAAWRLLFSDESLGFARRWVDTAPTELDQVESRRMLGRVHHDMGDVAARDAVVAELAHLAETLPDSSARGRAEGAIAQLQMIANRTGEAIRWAERAMISAERHGDEWLRAQASVERASALSGLDDDGAVEAILEAHGLAGEVGDAVLQSRALHNLLGLIPAHSPRGSWARAELRIATRSSGFDRMALALLPCWDAEAAYGVADMSGLRVALSDADRYFVASAWGAHNLIAYRAELAAEEGRTVEAAAMIESIGDRFTKPFEERTVRLIDAAARRDREAAEQYLQRNGSIELPAIDLVVPLIVDVVQLASAAGVAPDAIRQWLAQPALASYRFHGHLMRIAEGVLAVAEQRLPAGIAALTDAIESNPLLPRPVVASLRTLLGSALLHAGDRSGAADAARTAVEGDLARWPGWRRDRAEALLRRAEGTSVRSDGSLTNREREVAILIAEGLTNSQLAERLFISPKTAAVHVSNILMKLGLSGRAEVAAWTVRQNLDLKSA